MGIYKGRNVDEFVVDNKMPSATGKGYISYISNCDRHST